MIHSQTSRRSYFAAYINVYEITIMNDIHVDYCGRKFGYTATFAASDLYFNTSYSWKNSSSLAQIRHARMSEIFHQNELPSDQISFSDVMIIIVIKDTP